MIELELECANKHQKPILSVIFDNKYINNQKLLCHECMETFTEDVRIIGIKIVNQMIAESQKQKRDFIEILIYSNQQILKSIQLSLAELKSSIIQELDSLDQITNSWIQNLNNIKSDKAAFSFFEELDKLISYGKEKVSEINKQTICNEIKETNSLWNEQFKNQLNKFNMFEDCLKCQVILQDLTSQEQGKLPSNQEQFLEIVDTQYKAVEVDCKLKIENLKQIYEGEYQQKKRYTQIDNFIQKVLNDEFKRKKFQGNDQEIESEFLKKWEEFICETEGQSESQYLEMIDSQYKALKSISNKYLLNTENEQQYINYFRDVIIKSNPNNEQGKEQEQIFQRFMQEFSKVEQFIFINKTRYNLGYFDIFQQQIKEKLEKSKDQLLDMRQFYSQEVTYQVVAKQDIQNYLQNQFENDFQNYLKKCRDQSYFKTYYFNFLSILDYLQIQYNKKIKQQLDIIINNPTSWQSNQVSEAFSELKKSLKFYCNDNLELDFSGMIFGRTFQNAYESLKVFKIVDPSSDDSQKFRQELFKKFLLIDTEIEIKPYQNQFQEDFNYIMSPIYNVPCNFKTKFPTQFNAIMIDQHGWRKLYKELYDLIKQEIGYSKSTTNQQVYQNKKEDENISSLNCYLITSIMQKVKNNIKVKYNNQFAQYGVILSNVGERCIFYYCLLIIWRFLCYQKWNSKNIQQKHQKNFITELVRCMAEINQDNQKQSCIKATELVSKIQILLKNQFLDQTKKEVLQQMNQVSMSNVDLIAKLDKELLIGVNVKMFENEMFKKNILSYTTDHKSFINQYTLDMLTQVQHKLLTDYSNKYRKELSSYLKSIQENAKIFYKYIKNQPKEVKTIKYFVKDANEKDKIFYENYLFKLLIQCLLGRIEDKIDIIEYQYKEIFQVSNYNPVNNQLKINWQLLDQQDQQVYNLKSFVETLIEQINRILNNIDQIQFKQTEYQLDVELEKLKLQMNGCEYTCPCCKRKCDEDNYNDSDHIHKCQNGHQIRGINGILISHNTPSLYTCDEILDECMLRTLHSKWNFKIINDAKNIENKEKWKNVWNIGLGKLVCIHLEKQLNHEIMYSQKLDFEISIQNIHYILILDDSGSMQGEKWDSEKNGALCCIKSLENTDCAKVSVIIFNGDARIVVECQKPNCNQISSCISYKGGGINFDPPFKMALQLIEKYKGFNKIEILFYTGGEAGYPSTIIDQFCQLPPQIRSLINLIACSGEKSSPSLQLMIQKFQQHMQSAQLKNSVQPMEIYKIWTEVVSKNIYSN